MKSHYSDRPRYSRMDKYGSITKACIRCTGTRLAPSLSSLYCCINATLNLTQSKKRPQERPARDSGIVRVSPDSPSRSIRKLQLCSYLVATNFRIDSNTRPVGCGTTIGAGKLAQRVWERSGPEQKPRRRNFEGY